MDATRNSIPGWRRVANLVEGTPTWPDGVMKSTATVQYSWGLNTSISLSLSHTSLRATDCTRPVKGHHHHHYQALRLPKHHLGPAIHHMAAAA
jgi:hypothetical protein